MDPNGKEPAEGPFALLTLRAQSAQPHPGAQGPHTHFQPSTWEMCGPSKEAALHLTQHCSPPAPGAGKWPLVAEAFPGTPSHHTGHPAALPVLCSPPRHGHKAAPRNSLTGGCGSFPEPSCPPPASGAKESKVSSLCL